MKKNIALLLSIIITISGISVFAATPCIAVSNAVAETGETVNINISLENNPGIISIMLKLSYDSNYLELTNVEDSRNLGTSVFGNNKSAIPYKMNWNDDAGTENLTYSGVIATLTFKVKTNTPAGTYPVVITYDEGEIYNVDLNPVDFSVSNGSIKVMGNEPVNELSISNVSIDGGVSFEIDAISGDSYSGCFLSVLYDDNDRLLALDIKPASNIANVAFNCYGTRIIVMWWNSLQELIPLSSKVEYKIK